MAGDWIGLIAGRGTLPLEVIAEIERRGNHAAVVGVVGEALPELSRWAARYIEIGVGRWGKMIAYFKENTVSELVLAGKIGKEALFKGGFDELAQTLLQSLPEKNDDAILLAFVNALEAEGIHIAKQTDYLRHWLAKPGILCGELTGPTEQSDLRLGFKMAKAIGGLDIGQSVVVKQGAVIAVEAIEGTDQAILRGGVLGGPGAVVVKVSKPQQDERFDVPTIGPGTMRSLIEAQVGVLGIEAGKTFIAEPEEVFSLANQHRIRIVAMTE